MKTILSILTIFLFSHARAADVTHCGLVATGPHPYRYCITETPESDNRDVIYALPGAGGTGEANWWTTGSIPNAIKNVWSRKKTAPPRVIEVSFGPLWLLVPQNSHFRSGLFEIYTHDILPFLESKLTSAPAHRIAVGHSMGGLNSAIVGLLSAQTFDAIAMLSPALVGISPFAGEAQIAAYSENFRVPAADLKSLLGIARGVVNTEAEWAQFYPTVVVDRRLLGSVPRFLVSAGTNDLRFFKASESFANQIQKNGGNVRWAPFPGGHTDVDADTVAEFVAPSEKQ